MTCCPQSGTFRQRIFNFFDNPASGHLPRAFAMWIMTLILYSTVIFVLETVRDIKTSMGATFWNFSEIFCVVWFSFEYFTRLLTTENRWKFLRQPMNIIDLLAIAPFYLDAVFNFGGSSTFLRVLRLMRMFRIFKMGKYSAGMQMLANTMAKSFDTLMLLSVYLGIALVVFSAMIYFAECGDPIEVHGEIIYARPGQDYPSPYSSIPASFWWCLVTMTTVGYGDVFPTTPAGKVIGCVTMLCGIMVLALPINVIGGNFIGEYTLNQKKEEIAPVEVIFHTERERADFFEARCVELSAAIDVMKDGLEAATEALAKIENQRKDQELADTRRNKSHE
eukprot:c6752_g1_i1.p1 GENE.c6752_g1_i1~~c6752_g1_i1.p1  ORF type:complete len:381 (+),score=64.68 c6752_g1_i1:141-1145(+)